MVRKRRKTRSRTLTGQRIPFKLKAVALKRQKRYLKLGIKKSLQQVYREIAKELQR